MLDNRSLMRHVDNESNHDDAELSAPEDVEIAQRFPSSRPRRWKHLKLFQRSTLCWMLVLVLGISVLSYTWDELARSQRAILRLSANQQGLGSYLESAYGRNTTDHVMHKPSGVTVVGAVFYGRRQYVDILDCYLQRNLVRNGGFLDEVHFLIHTDSQDDINWLEELVKKTPGYKYIQTTGHYGDMWKQHLSSPDTLYIKIDDDIVYINDNAIPRMVHTLIDHPESYAISANAINSPEGHWLHYHTNAIVPYLPEPEDPHIDPDAQLTSWRPSELPEYPDIPIADHFDMESAPPRDNHRWLPLQKTAKNLHRTPIHAAAWQWEGIGLHSWQLASQQHASFFSNVEAGTLNRYFFGDENGVWNMQNYRYSINFIAIWGSTIQSSEVSSRDELDIAVLNPERLGRPLLIDSHALVSHFSFGPQHEKLLTTDFLDRYRAYANEMVCGKKNQKVRFEKGIL